MAQAIAYARTDEQQADGRFNHLIENLVRSQEEYDGWWAHYQRCLVNAQWIQENFPVGSVVDYTTNGGYERSNQKIRSHSSSYYPWILDEINMGEGGAHGHYSRQDTITQKFVRVR